MFEIGQWVSCEEGIGQIVSVRNQYYEDFLDESIFLDTSGKKIFRQFLIVKIFLTHQGKVKKRKRLVCNQSKYCHLINPSQVKLLNSLKKEKENEYWEYILFEERDDLDYIVTIEYTVDEQEKKLVLHALNDICWKLWPNFTFDEFKKEFEKTNLRFNFSTKINGYSIPGATNKIRLILYSKMMKIVSKKMIFYYAKALDEEKLFS